MKRFCIFCGEPPKNKNNEHVLPRWLIEMTGDPKRQVTLGINRSPEKKGQLRQYAFDQFTFPACEECNSRYANLEGTIKTVFEKIFAKTALDAQEISTLLDWFDKVRVGIWLGNLLLDKNPFQITPQFHIESRVGQFDRLLLIERSSNFESRLNFQGTSSMAFHYTPSAWGLSVNDYHFTNISFSFLLSRRLGFPFPEKIVKAPIIPETASALALKMATGLHRVSHPVIRRHFPGKGTYIFQPMFGGFADQSCSDFYNSNYVLNHSLDPNEGIGGIFVQNFNDRARPLLAGETVTIDAPAFYRCQECCLRSEINVRSWQNWLIDQAGTIDLCALTDGEKQLFRAKSSASKAENNAHIRFFAEVLRRGPDKGGDIT
jgi:hypothetical protein